VEKEGKLLERQIFGNSRDRKREKGAADER